MRLRSLLFVPADRPERYAKALASGADAIIIDLEDSVAPAAKPEARDALAHFLSQRGEGKVLVRVNPLDSGQAEADLAALAGAMPDGIMLPKAEGAASVERLQSLAAAKLPILPIASETPAAIFEMGSYRSCGEALMGLTWGAEDLPAAIGAATSRAADGSYTAPYELARSLTLFAAHAAGVPAIETVFPAIADKEGLAAYAARGRRDGFAGMMAIHPAQVPIINAAFAPSETEIAQAEAVVAAFAANPEAGALQLDGRMIDRPHLVQARRILAQAGAL